MSANVDRFSPAGLGQFCWTLSLPFASTDQKETDQIDSLLIMQSWTMNIIIYDRSNNSQFRTIILKLQMKMSYKFTSQVKVGR